MAEPDLQIRWGGGGGSSRPWDKGRGVSKIFFRLFGPQFGLKIRGAGPGPSPESATDLHSFTSTFSYTETKDSHGYNIS